MGPHVFLSLPLDLVDPPVVVQPDLLQLLVGTLPHQTDSSLTEIQFRVLLLFRQGLLLPLDLPFPPGGLRLEGVGRLDLLPLIALGLLRRAGTFSL